MNAAPLTVRDLKVDLAGTHVLRGVDLDVAAGEVVALLGANGSGKSTLVRAVVGLIAPRSGTATIFGTGSAQFSDRRLLGYVPQNTANPGGVPATVREVVTSGRLARRRLFGPATREDRRAVHRAIGQMGLADRTRARFSELSGGQQQRALIARALAAQPRLLVMDEPTAGVDYTHTVALAEVLREFAADGGAVLLVEHELGPLGPIVDRVVVLDEGRVAFSGPPGELPLDAHGHMHLHAHAHTGEPQPLRPLPTQGPL